MARFDPTRPDFSPYGFSCVRWTPTAMPRFDRHNEIELNLLESGSLMYLMGGKRLVVTAGRLTVFWAGVPHQILDFEDVVDYFVLTIPLSWFLQWRFPDDFAQRILHGETVVEPEDGCLAADKARFEVWSEDAQIGSEDRRHICLLEIEARLRRLALSTAADRRDRSRKKSSSKLDRRNVSRAEQMAHFIAQNYTQPLSAEMIGRHVSLHPNYAMALFQQTFGTTLIKYATEHRLSHAQRLLVTTEEPIANIAFSSGFGSLSRFNEAFRRAFGCTPREYRKDKGSGEEKSMRTR
jgi:AraC-like DNA-binding protein